LIRKPRGGNQQPPKTVSEENVALSVLPPAVENQRSPLRANPTLASPISRWGFLPISNVVPRRPGAFQASRAVCSADGRGHRTARRFGSRPWQHRTPNRVRSPPTTNEDGSAVGLPASVVIRTGWRPPRRRPPGHAQEAVVEGPQKRCRAHRRGRPDSALITARQTARPKTSRPAPEAHPPRARRRGD